MIKNVKEVYAKLYQQTVQNKIFQISLVKFNNVISPKFEKKFLHLGDQPESHEKL